MSIKVSRGPFLELEVQNGLATTARDGHIRLLQVECG